MRVEFLVAMLIPLLLFFSQGQENLSEVLMDILQYRYWQ
jgi:hypothetical protein